MKSNYFFICSLAIILLFLIYYLITSNTSTEISAAEARSNIQSGKYDYIIDVRTQKEWDEEHLENTISIPIGDLVSELPKKVPNKDARILFVCKKGIRAGGVVVIANKLGYNNVQSMIGNFKELQQ